MVRDDRSAREISRSKRRKAGDRSAKIANAIMKLSDPAVRRLQLDPELKDVVDRARKITSLVARRRAERALAGELRRHDLVDLDDRLAKVNDSAITDVAQFHLAERWRARLIEEGIDAAAELPGGIDDELTRLVLAARRERDTGRPPGASRSLFRFVMDRLKTPAEDAQDVDDADDVDDRED